MIAHTYHTCTDSCCNVCSGGLSWCTTCGGGEGSLPTLCPGTRMTSDEESRVYAGGLDFTARGWELRRQRGVIIIGPWPMSFLGAGLDALDYPFRKEEGVRGYSEMHKWGPGRLEDARARGVLWYDGEEVPKEPEICGLRLLRMNDTTDTVKF